MDFKFPRYSKTPHAAIQSKVKEANNQKAVGVVIYLGNTLIQKDDIKRGLIAAFQQGWNDNIQTVWLIYPNLNLLEISRKEVEDRSFVTKLV